MQSLKRVLQAQSFKTESPIEKQIVEELLRYDNVKFETQTLVGPYRIDIAFPAYKVGLELDGREYHTSESQRARDTLRDQYLAEVEGWIIERVPGWFCYRHPDISVIKALRHIPEYHTEKRYVEGKGKTIQWYISDLRNRGYDVEVEKLLDV